MCNGKVFCLILQNKTTLLECANINWVFNGSLMKINNDRHRRISWGAGGAATPPSILAGYLLGEKMEDFHG